MSKTRNARKPELKVVFDSSALYTTSASDLLSNNVVQLISDHSGHADLTVTWYLPEIVMHERQFQMRKRGSDLLPSIQKMEKLLGHNLNITESVIESSVKEAIEKQIQDHNIQLFHLAIDKVDWSRIMLDAVYRHPPFEVSEKEKGFRDAVIAEAFLQIVALSPSTPKICRVVLVTGDRLLEEAVRTRTKDCTNVMILANHEELKGLINTLVAKVGEEFVAKIQERAREYFFVQRVETTLYYKEKIADRINENFLSELSSLPKGSDRRENETWYISKPRFVRKDRQRVYWASRISVESKAFKYAAPNIILPSSRLNLNAEGQVSLSLEDLGSGGYPLGASPLQLSQSSSPISQFWTISTQYPSPSGFLPPYQGPSAREFLVANGKSIFEVAWSVLVRTNQKFSAPKVEGINFVETSWE